MSRSFLVWALFLGVGTAAIAYWELDSKTISYYYDSCNCWDGAQKGLWRILYLYAPVPGYLLAMAALIVISLSYRSENWVKWRRAALMMVFCVALGPGVLVNLVFKDNWGRPRPRETTQFGGHEPFLQPWQPGKAGEGKSFPCGHCAIGFYLALPFLFLRNRSLAWLFLTCGLLLGGLTGIARMKAGGHFLSDVLWSWGLVWLSGLWAMLLFKPQKAIQTHINPTTAKWVGRIVVVLLPVLTALMAVATPYVSSKSFSKSQADLSGVRVVLINCFKGNFKVDSGQNFGLDYQVYGFGFPGSKTGIEWKQSSDTLYATFEKNGFFTEFKNEVRLTLPKDSLSYVLWLKQGQVSVSPSVENFLSFLK